MATVKLFKNVPWSPGGHHVIRFPSLEAQASYFNSLTGSAVFNSVDWEPRPGADLKLSISFMDAKEYNYMSWQDGDSLKYFFIEDYEYLNDHPVTKLIVSDDIWQNNHLNMVINPGTVHRRHMPKWAGTAPVFYPVDEGLPRSLQVSYLTRLDDYYKIYASGGVFACVIITSKKLEDTSHPDGIFYYLTLCSLNESASIAAPGDVEWMNPLTPAFLSQFSVFGVSPEALVGAYLIPLSANLVTSTTPRTFRGSLGRIETGGGPYALFSVSEPRAYGFQNVSISIDAGASKNTSTTAAASYLNEPMVFSDNLQKIIITDSSGYQLLSIPVNLAVNISYYYVTAEVFSLTPQCRIQFRVSGQEQSLANGLEAVIPCIPLDIPQSNWMNYQLSQQSQQWNILENSIRSNYWQTAVGAATGAGSGAAFGSLYADSFNNSRRSPARAGAAGAAMGLISGVGSLVNAKITATEQRDNLKLNEGIIKNTPAPPIGGSNWNSLYQGGVHLISTRADEETINSIFSRYHAYGYIIDRVMDIPLRTRYYFDFIETRNAVVSGPLTSDARSYLEALFNQGITIWHGETFRGFNYDLNNPEV